MSTRLKDQVKKTILTDTGLYKKVCDALKVAPVSLPKMLQRNSERLLLHNVQVIISDHTGILTDDLIEDDSDGNELGANIKESVKAA